MDVKFDYGLLNDMLGASLEKKYKILTELQWNDITENDKETFLTKIYPVLRNQTFQFHRDINVKNKYLAKTMFYQFLEFRKKFIDYETHDRIKVLFVKWLQADEMYKLSGLKDRPVEESVSKKDTEKINDFPSKNNVFNSNDIFLPPMLATVSLSLWGIPQDVEKSFDDKREVAIQTAQNFLKMPELYIGWEYLSVTESCVNKNEAQNAYDLNNLFKASKQWYKALTKMNDNMQDLQNHLGNLAKINVHNFSAFDMKEAIRTCIAVAQDVNTELKRTCENCEELKNAYCFIETDEPLPDCEEDQKDCDAVLEEIVKDTVEVLSLPTSINSSKLAITFSNELNENEKKFIFKKESDEEFYCLKLLKSQNCVELFDKARDKLHTAQRYWSKMIEFLQKLNDIIPNVDIKLNEPPVDVEHAVFKFRIIRACLFAFLIDQAIRIQIKITKKHILPLLRIPLNEKSSVAEIKKQAISNCKMIKKTMQGTSCVYDHFTKNILENQNSIKAY